jgi:hypothetical protein
MILSDILIWFSIKCSDNSPQKILSLTFQPCGSKEFFVMDHDTQQRNPFIFTFPEPLPLTEFISRISELSSSGYSPLGFFGTPEREILCLMGKAQHVPTLLRTAFPAGHCYPSLSVTIPAFHIFERELWEEHGITPEGHPWLKPLRYPAGSPTKMESYPFFSSLPRPCMRWE